MNTKAHFICACLCAMSSFSASADDLTTVNALDAVTPKQVFKASHFYISAKNPNAELSYGPFAAVQSGASDTYDAIALGWMVGIDGPEHNAGGWNVGLGVVVKSNYHATDKTNFNPQSGGAGLVLMGSFSF